MKEKMMNNEYWFDPARGVTQSKKQDGLPCEYLSDIPQTEEPYIASEGLQRAVNLAIYLGRPLLLEGEPGCGKSRLARALAWNLQVPFFQWYVTSSTRARDGLYFFDALRRLNDVQLSPENRGSNYYNLRNHTFNYK